MTILNNGQPVTDETALNQAIEAADTAAPGSYEIEIGGEINLTTALEAINLPANVSLTVTGTTSDGSVPAMQTVDGGNDQHGFFVYSGAVSIEFLTLQNMKAVGGAGGAVVTGGAGGGGGGAGLGGGLFVAGKTLGTGGGLTNDPGQQQVPIVALNEVTFSHDMATGGAGVAFTNGSGFAGGGGGLGGAGGSGGVGGAGSAGGGGGIGGAGGSISKPSQPGIVDGASGGAGGRGAGAKGGGGSGGGGGGGRTGGGGGIGGGKPTTSPTTLLGTGGKGGFGGGGGGGTQGGGGGFGGGGGGGDTGGGGGFGGGGGGGIIVGGSAGFGGGGGLGAGGDIFVQQGATLIIENGTVGAGTVHRGTGSVGGANGEAYGGSIFIEGNEQITFSPGGTETVSGVIADMTGSNDPSHETGAGSVKMIGPGTLVLSGNNTYSGTTDVESGTVLIDGFNGKSAVTVGNGGTLGGTGTAGVVTVESGGTFAPGDPSTFTVASLTLNSGATFDEQIGGTAPGTGGAGGYDQTVVESGGDIALGGATLNVSLVNSFTPSVGDTFTVINNETGNPVSSTFAGLVQGATLTADGDLFQISYDGGGNNEDVTLTEVPCYCSAR